MQSLPIHSSTQAHQGTPRPSPEGITLQEFLRILQRRRKIILLVAAAITLAVLIWAFVSKPVYQAVARLLVEAPSTQSSMVDPSNPFSEILALTQPQSVDTQVEQMQSPTLLEDVEDKLHVNVAEAPDSLEKTRRDLTKVDLKVKAVDETDVIMVTSESTDPQQAASAANLLLQSYIDKDVNESQGEIRKAITFAANQEADARRRLVASEKGIERFKLGNRVTDLPTDVSQRAQHVAALTTEMQEAQVVLNSLRSQLAGVRRNEAAQTEQLATRVDVTNPAKTSLQDRIADLQQQRASMTQTDGYTDSAPQVQAINAQIATLEHRLAAQPGLRQTLTIRPNARKLDLNSRAEDLSIQIAAQEASVRQMNQTLASSQAQLPQYAGWEVTLAQLTREHDQAARLDNTLTGQLADLRLRLNAHHALARVDEVAQVPDIPVRPRKMLSTLIGLVIGLFLGICVALLQEFLDDRLNTVEDADRALDLPSLGYLPVLPAEDARLLPLMDALSPAPDSYRVLRTNIQFVALDRPLRTLLVTSAAPGEGKTTTAANLAFAVAAEGTRVIVVDTDLRRPALHSVLGLPLAPGLTNVLLGHATLQQTLLPQAGLPNMHTLSAGSMPASPADVLNSLAFKHLVDDLKSQCDLVIFDSPPMLATADAAILAALMDGTILIVEPGKTCLEPAQEAITQLRSAHASLLGVAYNKVPAGTGRGRYSQYRAPNAALSAPKSNGATALVLKKAPAETAAPKTDK